MDTGLLVLRAVVGLGLAAHGSQKLLGWFGGGGLAGTAKMMDKVGFRPAPFWALTASLGEFGGGLLIAVGLLSPLGGLAAIATMAVAVVTAHWSKEFFANKGGFEFPLTYLVVGLALALTGPGRYSLDALLGLSLPRAADLALTIAMLLGVLVGFVSRRRAPAADRSPQPA
jgi:putative oxidoreductase